ncbi:phosphatase PAP2 family protein [Chitinivibrio alkaliphilus]|uniref:Membrane-associated phospholipid phosphatase n=1 Tax=Chitinivibrio alkaliphilus ACht1 TaxID=1313304 RepID=U7D956_9BACT|nr:phosphatase PAP2 family protein [Chitinivibrio alkaliphilus]ERP30930.1 Membrane-associated phospholipid phosphatase [Chitinivibrio alkaliphilus ACht1]
MGILDIDYQLFRFFNRTVAHPFLDWFMPRISSSTVLLTILFGGFALYIVWKRGRRIAWIHVLCGILLFAATDLFTFRVLKAHIPRNRPANSAYFDNTGQHLFLSDSFFRRGTMGGASFPSNHASNTFGQAVFWALLYPKAALYLYGFAVVVAWSRIYLGAHYPLDVSVGALVGAVWGMGVYLLYGFGRYKKQNRSS